MSWILFAFSGPVLWAISTHLDKYLVEKYFKNSHVAVFLVFTALMGLIALPFIWMYEPRVFAVGWQTAAVMLLSGLLYMGAMLLYLAALQSTEASLVAVFFQAAPLIGYVLAFFVLGESLAPVQMLGGMLIVGGAAFASLRFNQKGEFAGRLVVLMLACAFTVALSSLIFKIFAVREEFWTTTFWMLVGEAMFGAGLMAVPAYRAEFTGLLRRCPGPVLSVNAANELINLGGGLGSRYALILAPLSLVQAVGSTTTIFVFAFGIILSIFWPSLGREDLSRGELMRKGCAALLVAAGTWLVNK
jgi:uncharacterized membrane protein